MLCYYHVFHVIQSNVQLNKLLTLTLSFTHTKNLIYSPIHRGLSNIRKSLDDKQIAFKAYSIVGR